MRRYGVFQVWILVPLSLLVLSARDVLKSESRHEAN
jgi:hypothetical protein